jgi:hypothetical protein
MKMILLDIVGNGSGHTTNTQIDHLINDPLVGMIGSVATFSYAVCGLLALIGGFRIYNHWQINGSDEVLTLTARWLAAIIAVLILGGIIQSIVNSQGIFDPSLNDKIMSR